MGSVGGMAAVSCSLLLVMTAGAAAAAAPWRLEQTVEQREAPPDTFPLLVSSTCTAQYLGGCDRSAPRTCMEQRDCAPASRCCATSNCPGVGTCQSLPAAAAAAAALHDRTLDAGDAVITLCLRETACRELGQCPEASACRPTCTPPDVCVLHRDERQPRCRSADRLCALYGACSGACPDLSGAAGVLVECDAGAGTVCTVVDGPPACVPNDCPAGLTCYVSALFGRECVDFSPCRRTVCPAGRTCREERVQCVRAPCPPIALCVTADADRLFPCRAADCAAGQRCVLAADGPTQPRALCVSETAPCLG